MEKFLRVSVCMPSFSEIKVFCGVLKLRRSVAVGFYLKPYTLKRQKAFRLRG